MPAPSLQFATITDLAKLLNAGDLSAVELAHATLDALEGTGVGLNAVAASTPERALREAHRADVRRRRGGQHSQLLGIPYGAKDLFAARGAPTAYGSPAFADQVLDSDATVIRRLMSAGAVLTAKLSLLELVGVYATRFDAASPGPGINPWSPDRWAGGSSTGSAAAVAAGLIPFAIGTETGGSIGCPSAYCGVTGFRPTYGLVSRWGAMPVSWSLDKVGPLARSATDCAIVLDAVSGRDRHDATTGRRVTLGDVEAARVTAVPNIRLGIAERDLADVAAPSIRRALANAVLVVRDLVGDRVRDISLRSELPLLATLVTITRVDAASGIGRQLRGRLERLLDDRNRVGFELGRSIPGELYVDALRVRGLARRFAADLFREVDVVMTFGEASVAPRLDDDPDSVVASEGANDAMALGNLAGLPAIFLPCGLSTEGMPVGIQFVGPPRSDSTLLAIGQAFQEATDWHRSQPPSWAPSDPASPVGDRMSRGDAQKRIKAGLRKSANALESVVLSVEDEPDDLTPVDQYHRSRSGSSSGSAHGRFRMAPTLRRS
jgi:aspartyl-tRNA(Asn)/glutamyl-tRNA(Gln) amidotransferase subunit A